MHLTLSVDTQRAEREGGQSHASLLLRSSNEAEYMGLSTGSVNYTQT